MRALVLYESLFGASRLVADAIGTGLGESVETRVQRIDVLPPDLTGIDCLVVGGPTHARSMTRPASRREAPRWGETRPTPLHLETSVEQPGVRELLASLPPTTLAGAAFATRADMSQLASGTAAAGIDRRMRRRGFVMLVPPASFRVGEDGQPLRDDLERATRLGRTLAARLMTAARKFAGSGA